MGRLLMLLTLLSLCSAIGSSDHSLSSGLSNSSGTQVAAPASQSNLSANIQAFLRFLISIQSKFASFFKCLVRRGSMSRMSSGGECGGSIETNDLVWVE